MAENEENDDDDEPQLSAHSLAALQEFMTEKDDRQKRFDRLKAVAAGGSDGEGGGVDGGDQGKLSMDMFYEDWNSSQFWYSETTASLLAREILAGAPDVPLAVAVVSAPSVFVQIKNLLASGTYGSSVEVVLLEFDERFAVFPEFVRYDYQEPLKLPSHLKGRFNRVICDPPFLSTECQTKAAMTARFLASGDLAQDLGCKVVVCTGERMEALIPKLYPGARTMTFEPQHAKGRLSNEFRCYSNFECESWKFRDPSPSSSSSSERKEQKG